MTNGQCRAAHWISENHWRATREVREETGLQIRITGLTGTYTDPHILIAYSDGEVRQEFTFVYAAEIESG
jgi:8-oxo-dGTP pyrophosphatase MutT (NUDIX family)